MRTLLVSALALGAMTSVALATEPTMPTPAQAGPVDLTDAQMDGITAGQDPIVNVGGIQVSALNNVNANVQAAVPVQAGVCAIVDRCNPDFAAQDVVNRASLR